MRAEISFRLVYLPLLGLLMAGSAYAEQTPTAVNDGALPPPPGPYVSSRTKLTDGGKQSNNTMNMPFIGNMPSQPMRYMPAPNQFPAPGPMWPGYTGR